MNNDYPEQTHVPVNDYGTPTTDKVVENPVETPVVVKRHNMTDPYISNKAYSVDDKALHIYFPTGSHNEIKNLVEKLSEINENEYTADQKELCGRTFAGGPKATPDDTFVGVMTKNNAVNNIKFSDKDLNIQPLKLKPMNGFVDGDKAVASFASLLGIGETIHVPLWHSGFWISLRPPKHTAIINMQLELASNAINLGRETSTMVYSNGSVVYTRIIVDFILSHMLNTTLDIPKSEDIRKHIAVQDLYPLVLGMLSVIYPTGVDVIRNCSNSTVLDENKKPKCDFTASGKVDLKKLLIVDRNELTDKMLSQMVNRAPGSVTLDAAKEYKANLRCNQSKVYDITAENGTVFKFEFASPSIFDYVKNGEKWVTNIVDKLEAMFTQLDSVELRESKTEETLKSTILCIYNIYVKTIEDENGVKVEGIDNINQTLELISMDDDVYNQFIKNIKEYLTNSVMAIVATPNYICPKCKESQANDGLSGQFKEFIPLNVLESFFDLRALKTKKLNKRNMS